MKTDLLELILTATPGDLAAAQSRIDELKAELEVLNAVHRAIRLVVGPPDVEPRNSGPRKADAPAARRGGRPPARRTAVARHIAENGPASADGVAEALGMTRQNAAGALEHSWFEQQADGTFRLTPAYTPNGQE